MMIPIFMIQPNQIDRMKYIALLLFIILSVTLSYGQIEQCGHQLLINQMELKHPGVTEHLDHVYSQCQQRQYQQSANTRSTRVAKVVFHILYENEAENIPDEVLLKQLDQLNQDYNRTNLDADSTRQIFQSIASGLDVRFELADIDPNGNPTNGINRVPTDVTSFFEFDLLSFASAAIACGVEDPATITPEQAACLDSLGIVVPDLNDIKRSETGGIEPWDTEQYINIWVGDYSINLLGTETPLILGFALPPFGLWGDLVPYTEEEMRAIDGITVHYQAIGPDNANSGSLEGTNDAGRTLTHEMGHYLGLRHIWGDGDCTEDDGIADTPAMQNNTTAYVQENFPNDTVATCIGTHDIDSCVDDDQPDMVENYMNYITETCQNMFSRGQAMIMEAVLNGPRAGLFTPFASTSETSLEDIQLYPNPATDVIYLSESRGQRLHGAIMTIDGITMGEFDGGIVAIGHLPAGIYVARIYTDNTTLTKRFVKH